eukprot:COSAG03_NODE_306_length_9154_cov_7.381999_4_plen_56_part_00
MSRASFESAVTVRTVRVGPSACRIIFTCLTHSKSRLEGTLPKELDLIEGKHSMTP